MTYQQDREIQIHTNAEGCAGCLFYLVIIVAGLWLFQLVTGAQPAGDPHLCIQADNGVVVKAANMTCFEGGEVIACRAIEIPCP